MSARRRVVVGDRAHVLQEDGRAVEGFVTDVKVRSQNRRTVFLVTASGFLVAEGQWVRPGPAPSR